jgi:hypothetical protein
MRWSRPKFRTFKNEAASPVDHLPVGRSLVVMTGLVYFALLVFVYVTQVVTTYYYWGFSARLLPVWVIACSAFLAILPLFWLPIKCVKPSDYSAWMLYLAVIGPAMIIPMLLSVREPTEVFAMSLPFLLAFILFELTRNLPIRMRINRITHTGSLSVLVLPVLLVFLSLFVLALNDFKFDISLATHYERRFAARELMPRGSIMTYVITLFTELLIPVSLLTGLIKRNALLILTSFFAALVSFSFDGQKATVVLPFVLIASVWFIRKRPSFSGYALLLVFTAICAFSTIEFFSTGSKKIAIFFVFREMVVPAELSTRYWEFFTENPLMMMTDSRIGFLFDSPYDTTIARLIGFHHRGDFATNANANIFATSFAEFGYFGLLAMGPIAGLFLKILDSFAIDPKRYVLACIVAIMIGQVWINGAFHTSLISNGLIPLLLFVWLSDYDDGPNQTSGRN